MAKLKIVEWPATVLETKAQPVTEFDDELVKFVGDLHETMTQAKGIGLAANQVDVLKRVIAIHIPFVDEVIVEGHQKVEQNEKKWWHDQSFTLINPEIKHKEGGTTYQEGCLSFPEIYEHIRRSEKVVVRAQDVQGKHFEVEADGLFAICLQHEIDHIDGVVFLNRMSLLKRNMAKRQIQKKKLRTLS